jgi:ATP-binding cassette, subfamily B, bacterial
LKTWQVIVRAVRFVPWLWVGNLIGITGIFISFQAAGLATREFFNLLTGEAPARLGYWAIIAFLAAGGVARIVSLVLTVGTNVPLGYRIAALLQKNILGRILSLPGARALEQSPGEAISRFRGDVDTIRGFPLSFNDLIAGLIHGGIAMGVMFWIDERIAAISMVPMVAVMFLVYYVRSRVEGYSRAARKAAGFVTGYIGELFGAVQAVKVGRAEESMIGQFRKLNRDRSETALRDRLFDQILHAIFHNAVNISTAVIMIVAAEKMKSGSFTIGDFALFTYYLPALAEMTWMMGSLLVRYRRAGVAVERMETLMQDAEPGTLVNHGPIYVNEDTPALPAPEKTTSDVLQSVEVKGLSYTFPDSDNGVHDVSFSMSRGSFTVVTGRIGSGKTTLLRTLLGLLPKKDGDVEWNGETVDALDDFFVPPRSAYTPQIPWLYSASLSDNLLMGLPQENGFNVDDAISAAVMEDDLVDLDDGLDTVVGPKGVRLSGGQMQRTAAARMFLRHPELFVFDDLSSALDVETEKKLWDRMFDRRESEKSTCLVVSHRRAALRHADQIVVMKDGKLEAVGQLEDLLESCEEMKRLWTGDYSGDGSGEK